MQAITGLTNCGEGIRAGTSFCSRNWNKYAILCIKRDTFDLLADGKVRSVGCMIKKGW